MAGRTTGRQGVIGAGAEIAKYLSALFANEEGAIAFQTIGD